METIGEKIKEARLKNTPYSEKEMADLLGISEESYRRIENGDRLPCSAMLNRISIITNVDARYLIPYNPM